MAGGGGKHALDFADRLGSPCVTNSSRDWISFSPLKSNAFPRSEKIPRFVTSSDDSLPASWSGTEAHAHRETQCCSEREPVPQSQDEQCKNHDLVDESSCPNQHFRLK